jgi:phthalate 4,5-dioxygenase
MLSDEDNELLCRVGPGTPMGEVFRRFWLPAVLSAEIRQNDGPPRRLRILGEDLIAFRDTEGRPGIISAYCPHKLAPLFFGRNEECGVRCAYHGWKFDVNGECVDIPNLPPNVNVESLKKRAKIAGYPTREAGGVVWVYMGPADTICELPGLEWTQAPESHVHVARWLQRSNWLQGMEGEIDSSHVSWLHRDFTNIRANPPVAQTAPLVQGLLDGAPLMKLQETDYGFVYGARRNSSTGDYYWRVTQWMMPMFSMIPNDRFPRTGRAWVPIDDYNTTIFTYGYMVGEPFTPVQIDYLSQGHSFPPPLVPSAYRLSDGYTIDTWQSIATMENDYRLDRMKQKAMNFSGIDAISDQDRALQENMPSIDGLRVGNIVDRKREILVVSDLPVITARRMLLKLAKGMRDGIAPTLASRPDLYAVRSTAALSPHAEFQDFLTAHSSELKAPSTSATQ